MLFFYCNRRGLVRYLRKTEEGIMVRIQEFSCAEEGANFSIY